MATSPSRPSSRSKVLLRSSRRRTDRTPRVYCQSKKPGRKAGLFSFRSRNSYLATRSFESDVPIVLKTDAVCDADVTRKNLSLLLAQYCSTAEVGSPPVFTWIV